MRCHVGVLLCVVAAVLSKGNALLCGRTSPLVYRHPSSLMATGHDDWYVDDVDDTSNGSNKHLEELSYDSGDNTINNANEDIRFYFATCIPGLADCLANELISFGALHVETQGSSGVRFEGTPTVGLKSILWCRTAHKIMELIASSTDYDSDYSEGIRTSNDLYQFCKSSIHTPSLLGNGSGGLLTLSVSTTYASKVPKELCHSHYTALTVKNALVDSVRELRDDGERPDVDVYDADVPLVAVIRGRRLDNGRRRDWRQRDRNNQHFEANFQAEEEENLVADVDIYRCLHSGGSAHRRGYRKMSSEDSDDAVIHRAAMKESLAAGLLLQAGWDKLVNAARADGKGAVLVDPMAGSATLPVEAALIACDMAPGLSRIASWRSGDGTRNPHRYPPAIRWKNFSDLASWDKLLNDAKNRAMTGMKFAASSMANGQKNVSIYCNEKNFGAAQLARSSIKNAGVSRIVSLSEGDCIDWDLDSCTIPSRTIFVSNPPWGKRLSQDIDDSWVNLREFIRREAPGCEVWVLSGNKDLTKILRMKKSKSLTIKTAEEELKWLQYHVFQKREVYAET